MLCQITLCCEYTFDKVFFKIGNKIMTNLCYVSTHYVMSTHFTVFFSKLKIKQSYVTTHYVVSTPLTGDFA